MRNSLKLSAGLFISLTSALLLVLPQAAPAEEVKVYEAPLTLPTYRLGAPEQMPAWKSRFGGIYPYTLQDKLTTDRRDSTYHAVYAENQWVRLLVLPEIGGRVHGAEDLTNGYQFMFNQRSIKPALVGMSGAWISGGIEWNFPDGHRVSGFRQSDWRITDNPDGSKTICTGEIERIYGMRWSVGNTVHSGRNWVETKVRLFNCTPWPHAFLYWADCGVRGTPQFQAVIPGEIATGHGKHQFFHWPVHEGRDLRRWENAPGGTSYFAWDSESDYFGTWNPEDNGGLVHVADHHIMRGKKLWFCGTSPAGRLWEVVLTDNDAPLVEPQAGAFSDNQPDYYWIRPGETKTFSHFWFPVRDIGPWHYANLEGSLALRLENGRVVMGWCPTGVNKGALVALNHAGREIYHQTVDADPGKPFLEKVRAPKNADIYDFRLSVLSAAGDTLLGFAHPRPKNPPLPQPDPPFPPAEKIASADSLYLIADFLERFRRSDEAAVYYQEALRRDPGDSRVNTAWGLALSKRGLYTQALEYFGRALERDPGLAEAHYYAGLCRRALGQLSEAKKELNQASYGLDYYAAAQYELAQLAAYQKYYVKALEHIGRSVRANADNMQALALQALILNRLGRYEEALAIADSVQRTDRLEMLSAAEVQVSRELLQVNPQRWNEFVPRDSLIAITRLDEQNHLELAIRYARCGQYQYAADFLELADFFPAETGKKRDNSPLLYYYMAYYSRQLGDNQAAASWRELARKASYLYCFPSRLETEPVLRSAIEADPRDGLAHFLLGTLLYSRQRPAEAIEELTEAVKYTPEKAVAGRNLGYALAESGRFDEARAAYERAVQADPGSAVALLELDMLRQALGVSPIERAAFLEAHRETVNTSDPLSSRLISLYVQLGRYPDALSALGAHLFHSWEGKFGVHLYWVECHIRLGDAALAAGDGEKALEHYRLAMTYPDNLEVKEQPGTIHARKRYMIATALDALGRRAEAHRMYEQVLEDNPSPGNAFLYFHGLALDKLGRKAEARRLFTDLLEFIDRRQTRETPGEEPHGEVDRERGQKQAALNHFRRSLALEGLDRKEEAARERETALSLDPEVTLSAFCPPAAGW